MDKINQTQGNINCNKFMHTGNLRILLLFLINLFIHIFLNPLLCKQLYFMKLFSFVNELLYGEMYVM